MADEPRTRKADRCPSLRHVFRQRPFGWDEKQTAEAMRLAHAFTKEYLPLKRGLGILAHPTRRRDHQGNVKDARS